MQPNSFLLPSRRASSPGNRHGASPPDRTWCSRVLRLGILASGLLSLACGDGRIACNAEQCQETDIFVATWWDSPPQQGGAGWVLSNAVQQQPFVDQINWIPELTSHEKLNTFLDERIFLKPPATTVDRPKVDTFLANSGWDILRWTPCGRPGAADLVALNDHYTFAEPLRFNSEVLRSVTCGTSIYALPVGLHRINHMLTAKSNPEECNLSDVNDLEDFQKRLVCLKNSPNAKRMPLVVPQDRNGEAVQFLVENIMLLSSSRGGYDSYWRFTMPSEDPAKTNSELRPQLVDALGLIAQWKREELLEFVTSTELALDALQGGTAAMMAMPDWFLSDQEVIDRKDKLSSGIFPGTADTFLFTSDVFAIPVPIAGRAVGVEPGLRWLDELLQPNVQHRFAEAKGAHPALAAAYLSDTFQRPRNLTSALEGLMPVSPKEVRTTLLQWSLELSESSEKNRANVDRALIEGVDQHFHNMFCQFHTPSENFEFQGPVDRDVSVLVPPVDNSFNRVRTQLCPLPVERDGEQ